jgi:hypothetical protein
MRRVIFLLTVTVLLLTPAVNSFSAGPEVLNNYYSDATFTTAVGWTDRDCDGSFSSGGTLTNYRYNEFIACDGQTDHGTCQEYDSGTGTWVVIECNEATALGGRLRVPIG